MKHRTLDEITQVADVIPLREAARALRRQRLERLAEVLNRHCGSFRTLSRIEYMPKAERRMLRADHSPLTIAFRDPVLRAQGLASDRLGDAMTFFNLSEREAHHLFCDCHYAGLVTPGMMAARTRAMARRVGLRELWDRTRAAIGWR